jgi:pimeloyl-ACP methyl ester carboxylesterase
MKRLRPILILWFTIYLIQTEAQKKISIGELEGESNVLQTDWGEIYYEIFGEGEPLLLLHGNGGSAKGKHAIILRLAKDYLVIAMDSKCHGNSSCPDGDLDYEQMAGDAFTLMEELGYEKYTIWGHSDGGILGLILGYKHSENIHKMLISGANIQAGPKALEPRLVTMMESYEMIPDPKMRKQIKLMVDQPNIPFDSLKKVNVPVLLVVGDRDAVIMEHTMAIFRSLPMANLCVLPGTTHFVEYERQDQMVYWLLDMKNEFKSPSTVQIMEEVAKSIFGDK